MSLKITKKTSKKVKQRKTARLRDGRRRNKTQKIKKEEGKGGKGKGGKGKRKTTAKKTQVVPFSAKRECDMCFDGIGIDSYPCPNAKAHNQKYCPECMEKLYNMELEGKKVNRCPICREEDNSPLYKALSSLKKNLDFEDPPVKKCLGRTGYNKKQPLYEFRKEMKQFEKNKNKSGKEISINEFLSNNKKQRLPKLDAAQIVILKSMPRNKCQPYDDTMFDVFNKQLMNEQRTKQIKHLQDMKYMKLIEDVKNASMEDDKGKSVGDEKEKSMSVVRTPIRSIMMGGKSDDMKPVDAELYNKVKEDVYKLYKTHSAYRSGMLVQKYKEAFKKKYGTRKKPYTGKKKNKIGLKRWFDEKWVNQRGNVGYKYKSDVYRPSKRITKKTPITHGELTKQEIKKARNEKYRNKRIKRFRKTKKKKK